MDFRGYKFLLFYIIWRFSIFVFSCNAIYIEIYRKFLNDNKLKSEIIKIREIWLCIIYLRFIT